MEETQWQQAATTFGLQGNFERRDRMLLFVFPEDQFTLIVDRRASLVEKLASFGFGYLALDLAGAKS